LFKIKNRVIKNASWIIACKVIQSLLGLVISMLTARYLGPSNYGLINYAASVVAFVVPIMQLGLNSILVQEIIEGKDPEGTIIGTATVMSFTSSLLCVAGVICFSAIANAGETETIIVIALYSILLICQSIELVQYWFQAKYLSKYTSIVMLVAYIIVSAYKIFLLATAKGVYWFAVSNAFDYFIISVALLYLYKRMGNDRLHFSRKTASRMFSRSKYYIISGLMVTIFAHTDRIMLKLMIDDSATGYYSAAVTCAGLTSFVFSAIIDSARPSIFESKKISEQAFEKNMSRLYSVIIYLSLLQSLAMTVLAGPIIRILYGQQYLSSIPALQIVVWYTTFSYMGAVRNIWMLSEGKQKYLWMINLSGALANVILNYILIPYLGIIGASIASLVTQFFTNVFVGYVFIPIKGNNRLMVAGLNPEILWEIVQKAGRK
jgi:O-antigen/teichoic acid export membrane protein